MNIENLLKVLQKFIDKYGEHLLSAAIILVAGYILYELTKRLFRAFLRRSNRFDEIILRFFMSVYRIIFVIFVVITALSQLGFNITSLVAVFTVASAGIALAVKDSVGGVVDGVKIMFARPFTKGDLIELDGVMGTIEQISLLYTFLLTRDNKKIVIPNSTIASSTIINYSSENYRRVDLTFDVSYSSDIDHVKSVIYDEAKKEPLTIEDHEPFVMLTEYKESALTFTLRVWTSTDTFEVCKFNLMENIKKRFDKEDIVIPFNQLDVKIKNPSKQIS